MEGDRASRTAVLVCQGRAAAHGRIAVERFADPTAMALLREDERTPVQWVRDGVLPTGWRDRIAVETVRASAEAVVPRTVAIDDAVRARPAPQLVVIGAGLDDRAYRLDALADVDVYEVDHPATQRDKRDRLGELRVVARSVRYVPVDLTRDPLDDALSAAGHRADKPTTWIWEGVVAYLRRSEVAATVESIAVRSAPGSRLVVDYQAPAVSAVFGRLAARAMSAVARERSVWADEPRRSTWTPQAMAEILARQGFQVTSDAEMLAVAESVDSPVRLRKTLRTTHITVADR